MSVFNSKLKTGIILTTCFCLVSLGFAQSPDSDDSQDPVEEAPSAQTLLGTWQVDLRPTPEAEPYFKDFIVATVDGSSFTGTFYDTPIEEGRINLDWGILYFAFVTRDGSGPYNHSGVLRDDKLEGLSHSLGRSFLSVWNATQAK